MARLSLRDVEHVAVLARLKLTERELSKFHKQLSEVVSYISELEEVETSGVDPTSQTTGLENVTRVDEAKSKNCLSRDAALSGTEKIHNSYFKVAGILEEKSDK